MFGFVILFAYTFLVTCCQRFSSLPSMLLFTSCQCDWHSSTYGGREKRVFDDGHYKLYASVMVKSLLESVIFAAFELFLIILNI